MKITSPVVFVNSNAVVSFHDPYGITVVRPCKVLVVHILTSEIAGAFTVPDDYVLRSLYVAVIVMRLP
jgi:hypothetical protein